MVVFPQAPELSTSRPQVAKNHRQAFPQENCLSSADQTNLFHTSTTPYYN